MKANRRPIRLLRDQRASTHVVEALTVATLIGISVIIISDTTSNHAVDPRSELIVQEDELSRTIDMLQTLPATESRAARYGSLFEELMLRNMAGERALQRDFLGRWDAPDTHGWLRLPDGTRIPFAGQTTIPLGPHTFDDRPYLPQWGRTIVQPGLSHYGTDQAVDLRLLPLHATHVATPNGHGLGFDITAKTQTGEQLRLETWTTIRAPSLRAPTDNPPTLRFTDSLGDPLDHLTSAALETNATHTTWTLHLRITPTTPAGSGFLTHGDDLVLQLPHGWELSGDQPEDLMDVRVLDASRTGIIVGEAVPRATLADPETRWWNLTLVRDGVHDPLVPEIVRVELDATPGAVASLVLLPRVLKEDAPALVHVDHADPMPADAAATARIVVTNPKSEPLRLSGIQVAGFAPILDRELATDLDARLTTQGWAPFAVDDETGLRRTARTLGVAVPAGGSAVIEFPFGLRPVDSQAARAAPRPYVDHVELGAHDLQSVPAGGYGTRFAWLAPGTGPVVGASEMHVPTSADVRHAARGDWPPGLGTYERVSDPAVAALLAAIQGAHQADGVEIVPSFFGPDDNVEAHVDVGNVLTQLRRSDNLDMDSVRLRVRAYDTLGIMTGEPFYEGEQPLTSGLGAAIVGLDHIDGNGDDTPDVLITYADGRLVALDGADLPHGLLWRANLGSTTTSPSVVLDLDRDGDDEVVVGIGKRVGYRLFVLEHDGSVREERVMEGPVAHLRLVDCLDRPSVAFIAPKSDEVVPGTSHFDYETSTPVAAPFPRVAVYDVEGLRLSEVYPAALAVAMEPGRMGLMGTCGLVIGYSDDAVRALRADDFSKIWSLDLLEPLQALWVADVRDSPLEHVLGQAGVDRVVDEVVVMTGEPTADEVWFEVLDGTWPRLNARPHMPTGVNLGPQDRFVSLTWLDLDEGYLVSERGHVWVTTSGGDLWVEMEGSPFLDDANLYLHTAVFDSEGRGLLLRDDGELGLLQPHSLDWVDLQLDQPELDVFVRQGGKPQLYQLDQTREIVRIHVPEWSSARVTSLAERPCSCSKLVSQDQGVVLSQAGGSFWWNGQELKALMQASHVAQDSALRLHQWNQTNLVLQAAEEVNVQHDDARLVAGNLALPALESVYGILLPNTSISLSGNTAVAADLANNGRTERSHGSARDTFFSERSLLHTTSRVDIVRGVLVTTIDVEVTFPEDSRHTIIDRFGNLQTGSSDSYMLPAGGSPFIVSYRSNHEPVDGSGVAIPWAERTDCTMCLISLNAAATAPDSQLANQLRASRWIGGGQATKPTLHQGEQGAVVLWSSEKGITETSAASGLHLAKHLSHTSQDEIASVTVVANETSEWLVVERGQPELGVYDRSGRLMDGPHRELEDPTLHISLLGSPERCSSSRQAGQTQNIVLHHESQLILGSAQGHLTLVDPNTCEERWSFSPSSAGGRIVVQLDDRHRALAGPIVVLADLRFEVNSTGTVAAAWMEVAHASLGNTIERGVLYELHTVVGGHGRYR